MSKFLTACFAGVAAAVAVAEDLAINVAADQTATYDQDATVTSVTLGSKAIASLTGVHTYTLTATAMEVRENAEFKVTEGASFVPTSANGVNLRMGSGSSVTVSDATVTPSGNQELMTAPLSHFDNPNSTLVLDGATSSVLIESAQDTAYPNATYTMQRGTHDAQNGNIGLFAAADKSCGAKIAVYSFKMFDVDNNLIRDFVPCRRLSDGVLGLYDLSDHSNDPDYCPFYTNTWNVAKPFTAPKAAYGEPPASGFERLAWIKSDGNQMINTGTGADHVELNFNSGTYGSKNVLFGAAWSQNSYVVSYLDRDSKHQFFQMADNRDYNIGVVFDNRDYTIKAGFSTLNLALRWRTEVYLLPSGLMPQSLASGLTFGERAGGQTVKEELVQIGAPGFGSAKQGGEISLFGLAVNKLRSAIAVYSMIIYAADGSVVRNLVPARRTADGVLGLYDLADHSSEEGYNPFYTNCSGVNKAFTAPASGEPLVTGFERLAWIKSNGNQLIKTGVSLTDGATWKLLFNTCTAQTGNVAISGSAQSQNCGYVLFLNGKMTICANGKDLNAGTPVKNTDCELWLKSSSLVFSRYYRYDDPMRLKFAPPAENFAAAPVRSTAKCRGIVIGDATKIEVVEPDGVQFVKIPLISDVGGFAGSPLDAAKLATLTANATLPEGMELWYRESDQTLYARRKQGLVLVVQ